MFKIIHIFFFVTSPYPLPVLGGGVWVLCFVFVFFVILVLLSFIPRSSSCIKKISGCGIIKNMYLVFVSGSWHRLP